MRISLQFVCLALILILPLGCGHRSSLNRKVIHGSVTCDGESVPRGIVRFVPIRGTRGPATSAWIVDGQYRAENRGGVPFGKHRVEIIAQRPTGKKIKLPEGEVDEMVDIGAEQYAGPRSPLICEVTAVGDGRMDFDIPK